MSVVPSLCFYCALNHMIFSRSYNVYLYSVFFLYVIFRYTVFSLQLCVNLLSFLSCCIGNVLCIIVVILFWFFFFFFFKQKTAYELRISDWSSDVCSSDLVEAGRLGVGRRHVGRGPSKAGQADREAVGGGHRRLVDREAETRALRIGRHEAALRPQHGAQVERGVLGELLQAVAGDLQHLAGRVHRLQAEADRRAHQALAVPVEIRRHPLEGACAVEDRKSTRLNSSH